MLLVALFAVEVAGSFDEAWRSEDDRDAIDTGMSLAVALEENDRSGYASRPVARKFKLAFSRAGCDEEVE